MAASPADPPTPVATLLNEVHVTDRKPIEAGSFSALTARVTHYERRRGPTTAYLIGLIPPSPTPAHRLAANAGMAPPRAEQQPQEQP